MKYQKERCLHCDCLKRPTNLATKYPDYLDETGTVPLTEYWFCSDKCYEEELKKYLDKLYWPEYNENNPPPSIRAQKQAMVDDFFETFGYDTFRDMDEKTEKMYFDRFLEPYREEYTNIIQSWLLNQQRALLDAKSALTARIQEEYDYRWNKEQEDYLKGLEELGKSIEKGFAKDRAWLLEQQRKEEERQRREEERRKREEERLKEKQEREEEKRRKEEEARAAKEAEEEKWRPRPFKL